jgi:hypothetical protein
MKTPKEFDCVKMKWDIQQKLLAQYADADPKVAREDQRRRIAADPLLGPLFRQLGASNPPSPRPNT